jgi:hypothetical protein
MTFDTDPLILIGPQAGQITAPIKDVSADAISALDTQQRYIALGEPVPIVFGRFRNGAGGVWVSPGATEARFQNDASNNVTAYYHLVISEGQISSIAVKDVFQRACRLGSHSQTYDRRAGTWAPGNFIVERAGKALPQCPYYCGSVGLYPDMSTLSYTITIPDGFDQWNRQVHLFIRGGMYVTRLSDSVLGPSDSFSDLVRWLMLNTSRVPTALVDVAALQEADTFLEYNGFTCNGIINQSANLPSFIAQWAPYFLLCESNNNGKRGLRPLLPTTAAGAISLDPVDPVYVFTEQFVIPDSVDIQYIPLAERQPVVMQVIWRQQLESDIGIVRTLELRYAGTASSGPYETHDLSAFCTNEDHAAKVGAYILAKRTYSTHSIRFTARPQSHNTLVTVGDIVRVCLPREATNYQPSAHDFYYQIVRITKTLTGEVTYEAAHFPTNSSGVSLIARDVDTAVGTGIVLTSHRTGISCDVNSSTDNTIPAETYIEPGDGNDPTDATGSGTATDSQPLSLSASTGSGPTPSREFGSGAPSLPDDAPDDGKDGPVDDAYPNWPAGYPKPTDPDWPSTLPTNTDPTLGTPYIEPIPIDNSSMGTPPSGFRVKIKQGAWEVAFPSPSTCAVGTPTSYPASEYFPSWSSTLGVKGMFRETGGTDGKCSAYKNYFTIWFVLTNNSLSQGPGGSPRAGGYSWQWPSIEILHVPTT